MNHSSSSVVVVFYVNDKFMNEVNLLSLELAINLKKSVRTRIDPRFNAPCININF